MYVGLCKRKHVRMHSRPISTRRQSNIGLIYTVISELIAICKIYSL